MVHHSCRNGSPPDFHFLRVSKEILLEATKLLYSTNTWDFDCPVALGLWIDTIPRNMLPWVRHLRLEMSMGSPTDYRPDFRLTSQWKKVLGHVVPRQFPSLRTLSLAIYLEGNILCWRKSQATTFNEMFRPLRSLSRLQSLFVIFLIDNFEDARPGSCSQSLHDDEVHRQGAKNTFWRRKEVGRAWAEEIRAVILDDENLPGQQCLDTQFQTH